MATISLDIYGELAVLDRLALLKLPPAQRRKMLHHLGKQVVKSTRARLREQRTVSGTAFAPRAHGGRKKLLRKMGRQLRVNSSAEEAIVTWPSPISAEIAYRQQYGVPEVFTPAKMRKIHHSPKYQEPATRQQAKALRTEGYSIRRASGKGRRRASLKWIQQNLRRGQAGAILRSMRGDIKGKASWTVKAPARPFLGASREDMQAEIAALAAEIRQSGQPLPAVWENMKRNK